jgi:hypothetical protein
MTLRRRVRDGTPHLRRTTLLVLLFAAFFSLVALTWQWVGWDHFDREDLGFLARLVPVFWSPYLGLVLLALWLDRRPLRAAVVLAGSVLVTLWGVYWHLHILVFDPGFMSQITSPLLITGSQWMGVACTGMVALVVGLLPSRPSQSTPEGEA